METKEQKILDFMSDEDYVPMKAKEIAMIMRVPRNEYHEFLEIIGKLELELKIETLHVTILLQFQRLQGDLLCLLLKVI